MNYRAIFVGWQEHQGEKMFPLFNIIDPRSEFCRSTVGVARLASEGFAVDEIKWSKDENA